MGRVNVQNPLTGADVLPPMIARPSRSPMPRAAGKEKSLPVAARSEPRSKKSAQRFKMLNQFVDDDMQNLTPRQLKVWLCLYRDSYNGVAKSEQGYIAKRCGLRRPTVSTTIGQLEELGLVKTIHQGGLNKGISTYSVTADCRHG